MGGYRYKDSENKSLEEIIKDNPGKSDSELASMAFRYNICPNRSEKALALRIASLRKPKDETSDDVIIDGSHGMRDFLHMKADRDCCRDALDDLLEVLIGSSTLYIGENYDDLRHDIKAIHGFLWRNYGDLMAEKIESLRADREAE